MSALVEPERSCGSQHCITCGDDGDPMIVVKVDRDRGLALCSADDGVRASVETALVEPVAPGERLLVHAGTAIARLESVADLESLADVESLADEVAR